MCVLVSALCLLLLATPSLGLDRRQLLLPRFLYLRLADLRTGRESTERQQRTQPTLEPLKSLEPVRNDVIRPCYFSPVQCLLRTEGQHRVFENHPSINHFRTKSLRGVRRHSRHRALGRRKGPKQQQLGGAHKHQQ